jgi:hypothetical protein
VKKWLYILFACTSSLALSAQTKVGDRWVDNDLEWVVLSQSVRNRGTLELCIGNKTENRCVENVFTAFEIRVFDSAGKEIWNGLWKGDKKSIRFRKALPEAARLEIKATRSFVINWMTGSRIHQDKALELSYPLP